jgi:hypothetical protein
MPTNEQSDNRLDALRNAPPNSWIALSSDGEKLVAVAESYAEVVKMSEQAGIDDPTVLKAPQEWMSLSL